MAFPSTRSDQVRARINASGGSASVSDTSIFDAAVKAVTRSGGSGGGDGEKPAAPDAASLVDTLVQQVGARNPAEIRRPFRRQSGRLAERRELRIGGR